MFPTGVIHDRIRNPACLAVPPVEAVSADRELSAGQLQSRFGALFGRLDQRLGLRLGILMRPERLARKGLRALFAGRRCVTPGAVNNLFMPLAALVPSRLIRLIKRRAKFYRYGR